MSEVESKKFEYKSWQLNMILLSLGLGLVGLVYGFCLDAQRTWANILIDGLYFLFLTILSAFIVAVLNVAGARWHTVLRRIPETIMGYFPIAALLLCAVLLGYKSIYLWGNSTVMTSDPLLANKITYFKPTFFVFRFFLILAVWCLFTIFLRRKSLNEDKHGSKKNSQVLSALFLVFFAYSFSLASFDWIMSIEPHWTTTMFGVYNFAGCFVNAIAVVTLSCVLLSKSGVLSIVNESHFHDLGKLLFAFVFFWAYIWFCQFMLIWYGNIPEETVYYAKRLTHDWSWLFYFNFFLNFVVPFLVLLPRQTKRNSSMLMRVCIVLLIGHWLDLYLLVVPGLMGHEVEIGFSEISIALGYAGLFMFCIGKMFSQSPVFPVRSPFLAESIHHHQ